MLLEHETPLSDCVEHARLEEGRVDQEPAVNGVLTLNLLCFQIHFFIVVNLTDKPASGSSQLEFTGTPHGTTPFFCEIFH
jgi:hypothetical protein